MSIELIDLIDLCDHYSNLGEAIQEQLTGILDGQDLADQNPNALEIVSRFLNRIGRYIQDPDLNEEINELNGDILEFLSK